MLSDYYWGVLDNHKCPILILTDVGVKGKEVGKGTQATLTCVVSDLTGTGMVIKWFLEAAELTSNDKYLVNNLAHVSTSGSQVSQLTVVDPKKSEVFTCQVSSNKYSDSPISHTLVNLFVYGKRCFIIVLKYWSFCKLQLPSIVRSSKITDLRKESSWNPCKLISSSIKDLRLTKFWSMYNGNH